VSCLYASDYGPPEPGFDPLTDSGRLIKGFEAHSAQLARATNLGQLQAMERVLQRGGDISWCDQGYGWVDDTPVHALFAAIVAFVILPYAAWKLAARFRVRLADLAAIRGPLRLQHPFRK
jgi:hypothetical protein